MKAQGDVAYHLVKDLKTELSVGDKVRIQLSNLGESVVVKASSGFAKPEWLVDEVNPIKMTGFHAGSMMYQVNLESMKGRFFYKLGYPSKADIKEMDS